MNVVVYNKLTNETETISQVRFLYAALKEYKVIQYNNKERTLYKHTYDILTVADANYTDDDLK